MFRNSFSVYETPAASVWRRATREMLRCLFPMPCLDCGQPTHDGLHDLGLCPRCRGRLLELQPTVCSRCSLPFDAAAHGSGFVCLGCRSAPPAFDRLVALWVYRPPVDAVIHALKFSHLPQLSRPLGKILADHLKAKGVTVDIISFVPLHWRRRLARGYDQAQEIASAVAREYRSTVTKTLARRRWTEAQSRLPRKKRHANVSSAFRVKRYCRLKGRTVLLLDDVATSGATLAAAARQLKHAGADTVTAAVVGRTPHPDADLVARSGL